MVKTSSSSGCSLSGPPSCRPCVSYDVFLTRSPDEFEGSVAWRRGKGRRVGTAPQNGLTFCCRRCCKWWQKADSCFFFLIGTRLWVHISEKTSGMVYRADKGGDWLVNCAKPDFMKYFAFSLHGDHRGGDDNIGWPQFTMVSAQLRKQGHGCRGEAPRRSVTGV